MYQANQPVEAYFVVWFNLKMAQMYSAFLSTFSCGQIMTLSNDIFQIWKISITFHVSRKRSISDENSSIDVCGTNTILN